jgi:hypothetical protein
MTIQDQANAVKAQYGDRCSILPIGKRAIIVQVKMSPKVWAKRYLGKFLEDSKSSQFYADEKLWVTGGVGAKCPDWTEGTGSTPEAAVYDAMKRTEALMKDLTREHSMLQNASLLNPMK